MYSPLSDRSTSSSSFSSYFLKEERSFPSAGFHTLDEQLVDRSIFSSLRAPSKAQWSAFIFFVFSRINGPKLIARNYFLTASRNEQTAVKSPSKRRKEERFRDCTIDDCEGRFGNRKRRRRNCLLFVTGSNNNINITYIASS